MIHIINENNDEDVSKIGVYDTFNFFPDSSKINGYIPYEKLFNSSEKRK
jgi:hypothetical protein